MNIPEGMTEEEVLKTIDLVIDRIAPRYTFYGFQLEDIQQESFIICLKALEKYEVGRPLENFLSFSLANRLKNLIRDNHYSKDDNEEKKKIIMPGQLSNEESSHYYNNCVADKMNIRDLISAIDKRLPSMYREDYIKLINGVTIPKKQRDELIKKIKDIAIEEGYEDNF
jgi:DNA-directed RNA polymerase specialized sigma24 family protein